MDREGEQHALDRVAIRGLLEQPDEAAGGCGHIESRLGVIGRGTGATLRRHRSGLCEVVMVVWVPVRCGAIPMPRPTGGPVSVPGGAVGGGGGPAAGGGPLTGLCP